MGSWEIALSGGEREEEEEEEEEEEGEEVFVSYSTACTTNYSARTFREAYSHRA